MKKPLALAAMILFIVSAVSASFGVTANKQDSSTEELSLDYRLGFIVTDKPVKIDIASSKSDDYRIIGLERSFRLQPGEVSEKPKGSGWYAMGDEYVKIQYRKFRLNISEQRSTNKVNFTLQIDATPRGAIISQTRELDYTVNVRKELENEPRFWKESSGEKEEEQRDEQEVERDQKVQSSEDRESESRAKNSSSAAVNLSGEEELSSSREKSEEKVNALTYLMIAVTLLLALYVVKGL